MLDLEPFPAGTLCLPANRCVPPVPANKVQALGIRLVHMQVDFYDTAFFFQYGQASFFLMQ
jgi:hypothetical protein